MALVHQKLSRAQKFCLVSQQKHGSRALLGTKSKNLTEGPEKDDEVLTLQAWGPKSIPSIYVKSARCGGAHCGGEQFPLT